MATRESVLQGGLQALASYAPKDAPKLKLAPKVTEPNLITKPLPIWQEDKFDDIEDYREKMVRLVEDLFDESREYYVKQKSQWAGADRLYRLEHILNEMLDKHPSKTRMPYLPQAIEEWLAVRHGDDLRPSVASRQTAYDPLCAAGNYIMSQELDANRWNLLRLRVAVDQLKFGIGFVEASVNRYAKGVFGQDGEHNLERIDPRYVWPDRFAKSWRWKDMKYLIIATPMDRSDVVKLWPDRGHLVPADNRYSLNRVEQESSEGGGASGGYRLRSGSNAGDYQIGQRERVLVLKCYLRDGRMRKVPKNLDENGDPVVNADGSVDCEYVERYPNGRLVIVANGVLLRDTSNPWDHGTPGLISFPEGVSDELFSYSRIQLLDLVERKLNLLFKESYENMRVHMNNQWVIDRNAFTKPSQFDEITQDPKLVFIVRPNSRILRLPPGNLPPELFEMFSYIKDTFDQVLGVTKIDRGQLEKGSQLSADSVIQLQGASGQRQVLKKKLDREAVKELGMVMFSNFRQFYPKKMSIVAKDPSSGEDITLDWHDPKSLNDWDVKIEAGDTASAESSAQQRSVTLYDKGIIDGVEVLRVLNWSNKEEVLKRMREERTRLAELGFVKEALKLGVVSRAMSQNPGRRASQEQMP